MLTDRGRAVLAFGGVAYLTAWAFGSTVLYPTAVGLVLAVAGAAIWVRLLKRPMRLRRSLGPAQHVAGDDVRVQLELDVQGRFTAGTIVVTERFARLGERETPLGRRHGGLRGAYVLERVPRGRYPIESAEVVVEDPFGLERSGVELPAGEALLVYPDLVELDRLFSESGTHAQEGRRLLLRRPSGFDLHSVREYEPGESLRRVHWPLTAKRGELMVKDLEDAPRDEAAILLDADATVAIGDAPDSTFELQVRAAGSILRAHASRGKRASLIVNGRARLYQQVHSFDGDWSAALELLAAVEPDGDIPASTVLADEAGPAARALELTVVTSVLSPRLVERLIQRTLARHLAVLVYVDPASFGEQGEWGTRLSNESATQLIRLERIGVPVAVLRRGDDLLQKLSGETMGVAVG